MFQKLYNVLSKETRNVSFSLRDGKFRRGKVRRCSKTKVMLKNYKGNLFIVRYRHIKSLYLAKYLLKKYQGNKKIAYYLGYILLYENQLKWAKRCFQDAKGYKLANKYLKAIKKYHVLKKEDKKRREEFKKQATLKQKLEASRKDELAKKAQERRIFGKWIDNFEKAKKLAQKFKRPILVNFTGSDWCGWCIRLEREVFSKPAFLSYARKKLVLLKLDFPRRKKISDEVKMKNNLLLRKYGVRGFPTILILNSEGVALHKTGYRPGGAEKYIEHLKSLLK